MSFDDLKPSIKVEVEGQELTENVTAAISRVEVDQSRDIADQITLSVANPIRDVYGSGQSGIFEFLESKAFQPGNEVKVFLGYGDRLSFVGAGIIQRFLPSFPQQGVPSLSVVARDASVRLMDGETAAEARSYPQFDLDTAVREVLNRHDIVAGDITPLFGTFRSDLQKKKGMTDYQFVKGLANLAGHEFKVKMNEKSGLWEAFWRPPTSDQTQEYTFTYQNGPASTLLSFDPEWGLHDAPTEVQVFYFDKASRTFELLKATGTGKKGEALKYTGPEGEVLSEITDLDKIRIAAGGASVEVVPERPFRTPDEAERFAVRWLKARRDLFLTGRGRVAGLEKLRAGDVHVLDGIGVQFSGKWEFTSVKHVVDRESGGYFCDFFANKVMA